MNFISAEFFILMLTVSLLYQLIPAARLYTLLAASYFFYASWNINYLSLIIISTLVDYLAAGAMPAASDKKRKALLLTSLLSNLGILFTFKYFNFFADSFARLAGSFGFETSPVMLNVLLPVGISFYTFQTLSYTIDVYRGKTNPENNLLRFAVFVAFFPQLVAGPIERSSHLLPQLSRLRGISYRDLVSGVTLAVWGVFKKAAIADRIARMIEPVFSQPGNYSGQVLVVAAVLFAWQIYCDFSGYTDIARGTARIFGIDLMENFNRPYAARSIADFWRRWHISLSTWFRDYVYISLGGNRVSKIKYRINIFVTFLISGLWHGANLTFLLWGILHGLFFVISHLSQPLREKIQQTLTGTRTLSLTGPAEPGNPSFKAAALRRLTGFMYNSGQLLLTFSLVTAAWILFRADNVTLAIQYYRRIFTWASATAAKNNQLLGSFNELDLKIVLFLVLLLELTQLVARNQFAGWLNNLPVVPRWAVKYALLLAVTLLGVYEYNAFIYFQF